MSKKEKPGVAKPLKKYGKDLENLILAGGSRQYRAGKSGDELERFVQGLKGQLEAFMHDHGGSLLSGTYHQPERSNNERQLLWTGQGKAGSRTVYDFVITAEPGKLLGGDEGWAGSIEVTHRDVLQAAVAEFGEKINEPTARQEARAKLDAADQRRPVLNDVPTNRE